MVEAPSVQKILMIFHGIRTTPLARVVGLEVFRDKTKLTETLETTRQSTPSSLSLASIESSHGQTTSSAMVAIETTGRHPTAQAVRLLTTTGMSLVAQILQSTLSSLLKLAHHVGCS